MPTSMKNNQDASYFLDEAKRNAEIETWPENSTKEILTATKLQTLQSKLNIITKRYEDGACHTRSKFVMITEYANSFISLENEFLELLSEIIFGCYQSFVEVLRRLEDKKNRILVLRGKLKYLMHYFSSAVYSVRHENLDNSHAFVDSFTVLQPLENARIRTRNVIDQYVLETEKIREAYRIRIKLLSEKLYEKRKLLQKTSYSSAIHTM